MVKGYPVLSDFIRIAFSWGGDDVLPVLDQGRWSEMQGTYRGQKAVGWPAESQSVGVATEPSQATDAFTPAGFLAGSGGDATRFGVVCCPLLCGPSSGEPELPGACTTWVGVRRS